MDLKREAIERIETWANGFVDAKLCSAPWDQVPIDRLGEAAGRAVRAYLEAEGLNTATLSYHLAGTENSCEAIGNPDVYLLTSPKRPDYDPGGDLLANRLEWDEALHLPPSRPRSDEDIIAELDSPSAPL